jgi:hypothetical protein
LTKDTLEVYVHEIVTANQQLAYCLCQEFWANTDNNQGLRDHQRRCTYFKSLDIDHAFQRQGGIPVGYVISQITVTHPRLSSQQFIINNKTFARVDHGASISYQDEQKNEVVTDMNMCFYLCVCLGDMSRAMRLKIRLAPIANQIAQDRGRNIDYACKATMAEDEVLLAYAQVVGPLIVVYEVLVPTPPGLSHRSRPRYKALKFAHTDNKSESLLHVLHLGVHFQELHEQQHGRHRQESREDVRLPSFLSPSLADRTTSSLIPARKNANKATIRNPAPVPLLGSPAVQRTSGMRRLKERLAKR